MVSVSIRYDRSTFLWTTFLTGGAYVNETGYSIRGSGVLCLFIQAARWRLKVEMLSFLRIKSPRSSALLPHCAAHTTSAPSVSSVDNYLCSSASMDGNKTILWRCWWHSFNPQNCCRVIVMHVFVSRCMAI